jgi:hypothetical protein
LTPARATSLFENTIGNPIFYFFNTDRNAPKEVKNRNMDILILNLLSKLIFDFGKWSNGKYANTRIRVFLVRRLPEVKN